MSIAKCPSCRDEVSLPKAPAEARVQCPLCRDEFLLHDALKQLPPELILLDQTPSSGHLPGAAAAVAEGEVGEYRVAEDGDSAPAFHFEEASAPPGQRRFTAARPSRPQRNPLIEVVKIVGGGVVGILLAILILWWGFKKDIGIKDSIPPSFAWIMPQELRPSTATNGHLSEREANGEMQWQPVFTDDRPGGSNGEFSGDSSNGGFDNSATELNPFDSERESPAPAGPKVESPIKPETAMVVVQGSPKVTADEFEERMISAQLADQQWDAEVRETGKAKLATAQELYASLARIGQAITFVKVDDRSADLAKVAQATLMAMNDRPAKLSLIGREAARSLAASTNRSTQGILLYGSVKSIRQSGSLFVTRLQLFVSDTRIISIVSPRDPSAYYGVQDRLFVLGTVVRPASRIASYEGRLPLVVVGGLPVVLPAENPPHPQASR